MEALVKTCEENYLALTILLVAFVTILVLAKVIENLADFHSRHRDRLAPTPPEDEKPHDQP